MIRNYSDDLYFASLETDEIGTAIVDKRDAFMEELINNGLHESWIKRWRWYYGQFHKDAANNTTYGLDRVGDQGEFIFAGINHLRGVLKTIYGMAIQNQPVFDVRSVNTNSSSNQLAALGKNIIDFYMTNKNKNIRKKLEAAVEHCLLFDRGFMLVEWDPQAGREFGESIDPVTGQIVSEGDVRITTPTAFDVAYDPLKADWDDHDWFIITEWVNKWDLIARYADDEAMRDAILGSANQEIDIESFRSLRGGRGMDRLNDDVQVLTFMHRKTDAMPDGRWVKCLADGTVLTGADTSLPYDAIPLESMTADELVGSSYGFSPINNLITIQEALNVLNSSIITNQYTHGVSMIAVPEGAQLSPGSFGRGMIALEVPDGREAPKAINFTATPGEIFQFRNALMDEMNLLTGVTSTSRGASPSGTSGAAKAFDASITAQNQGPFQAAYAKMAGDVATTLLRHLRLFSNSKREIILGKHNSQKTVFESKDLMDFESVVCELGNPMTRTFQGKTVVAETLLNMGAISGEQYFEVLTSGNLENALEGPREEIEFMRWENEQIMDGNLIKVHSVDNHEAHLKMHRRMLMLPELRSAQDQKALQTIQILQQHMAEHEEYIAQAAQMQMLQQQAAIAQAQGGGRGAPQGQGGDPTADELGIVSPTNPAVTNANNQGVQMPQMPKNPVTGGRANPATG